MFIGIGFKPIYFAYNPPITITYPVEAPPGGGFWPAGASAFYDFTTNQGYSGGAALASSLSDLTVTRASVGSAPDASAQFAANVARRGSWGLLDEAAATNLLLWSQAFNNAVWNTSGGSVTVTTGVADPAGTTTAATLTGATPGGIFFQSYTTVSGQVYSPSVYMRRRTGTGAINLRYPDGTSKNVTSEIGSTWVRVSAPGTASSTSTNFLINIATAGDAIDIAFAGAELGSLTSYVPTTSTTATRAADSLVLNVKQAGTLTYKFDNDTTQSVAVTVGNFAIPTNLPRAIIKTITIQ